MKAIINILIAFLLYSHSVSALEQSIKNCWIYDNRRLTSEHQYGEKILLWESGGKFEGVISSICGEIGALRRGSIVDISNRETAFKFSFINEQETPKSKGHFVGLKKNDKIEGRLNYTENSSCEKGPQFDVVLEKRSDCAEVVFEEKILKTNLEKNEFIKKQSVELAKEFERCLTLIQENCGDCSDITKEGLQKGLKICTNSIDHGYEASRGDLLKIAEGFNTFIAVYLHSDSPEENFFLKERNMIYEKMLSLNPNDGEALYAIISTKPKTANDRIKEFKELVKKAPLFSKGHFALGESLMEAGQLDAGVDEVIEAIQVENASQEVSFYASRALLNLKPKMRRDLQRKIESAKKAKLSKIFQQIKDTKDSK